MKKYTYSGGCINAHLHIFYILYIYIYIWVQGSSHIYVYGKKGILLGYSSSLSSIFYFGF